MKKYLAALALFALALIGVAATTALAPRPAVAEGCNGSNC